MNYLYFKVILAVMLKIYCKGTKVKVLGTGAWGVGDGVVAKVRGAVK